MRHSKKKVEKRNKSISNRFSSAILWTAAIFGLSLVWKMTKIQNKFPCILSIFLYKPLNIFKIIWDGTDEQGYIQSFNAKVSQIL
jgi:hypothetical protein